MSIWRFSEWIVPVAPDCRVSLGEGDTPLLRSRSIAPQAGCENLFLKLESGNPSGSYKDRFAAAAISHMIASGQRSCLATSSGNTGSALAAYCAAARISCLIAIVETTPDSKLRQMLAHGAKLARVKGFGLDSLVTARIMELLERCAAHSGAALQISAFRFSPAGMSGVQTISYELAEQFPEGLDHVFCPAGGGGLTLAVARGFELLAERGVIPHAPAIHCVQPAGNDTIAGPLRNNSEASRAVACTSQISGLQVPNVIDGDAVITACRRSGGTGHVVSDEDVWCVQQRLAREEGIFCEPAGAVALTGALQAITGGQIDGQARIACLVTGSAFKDTASLERMSGGNPCGLIDPADFETWFRTSG